MVEEIPNQVWNDGMYKVWNDGMCQVCNDKLSHPELDSGSYRSQDPVWELETTCHPELDSGSKICKYL